jgi:hypothetical protein
MGHNRKLVIGGVALTKARVDEKAAGAAMDRVRDEIEKALIQSHYFDDAPFKWISLMIREGLQNAETPRYSKINKTYEDLPVVIEIDVHRLISASSEEMANVYREATLSALIYVGDQYGLSTDHLRRLRNVGR